jgi:hypothetical protein
MNSKPLVSFSDYQTSLLQKGMAISPYCSSESYGKIIFNQVIPNPSTDLSTVLHEKISDALKETFQDQLADLKGCSKQSDEEYVSELVESVREENHWNRELKNPELEWIDSDDPIKGVMRKFKGGMSSYFDVRVDPNRIKEIWLNELYVETDARTDGKILQEIGYVLEDLELEGVNSIPNDWESMLYISEVIYDCFTVKMEKKYKEVVETILDRILSPIFKNYRSQVLYVASLDTTYFSIDRPYFYPTIAAERLDGSFEVVVFDGLNT